MGICNVVHEKEKQKKIGALIQNTFPNILELFLELEKRSPVFVLFL